MNASELIDKRIAELDDWRGKIISQARKVIHQAVPDISEEWKWDTPVFSQNGNIVAAGAFQDHVKLNFFKGALLDDPDHLFNSGLDAKTTRSIDIRRGDTLNEAALKNLIRAAAALNTPKTKPAGKAAKSAPAKKTKSAKG